MVKKGKAVRKMERKDRSSSEGRGTQPTNTIRALEMLGVFSIWEQSKNMKRCVPKSVVTRGRSNAGGRWRLPKGEVADVMLDQQIDRDGMCSRRDAHDCVILFPQLQQPDYIYPRLLMKIGEFMHEIT